LVSLNLDFALILSCIRRWILCRRRWF